MKALVIAFALVFVSGPVLGETFQERYVGPKRTGGKPSELPRTIMVAQVGTAATFYTGSASFYVVSATKESDGTYSMQVRSLSPISLSSSVFTVNFGGASVGTVNHGNGVSTSEFSLSVTRANGATIFLPTGTTFARITQRPTGNATVWTAISTFSMAKAAAYDGPVVSDSLAYFLPDMNGASRTIYLYPGGGGTTVSVDFVRNACLCAK